ncbi:AAA family ATPase [bacterium]|nr:AAA family ATPase [bacterium]
MKKVFVAATRQNDGKTMVSLGLFANLRKRLNSISYMKPVGQQYLLVDGEKIDKDAVLFRDAFQLKDPMKQMSPIAVPKGFTQEYVTEPRPGALSDKIKLANNSLSDGSEFMLYEGTGHAGVGSVIDVSNADVAKLLGSKVIIVSIGGIGRSIDEIVLNKSLFEAAGVEVMGVIINKVLPEKYDKINKLVRNGLALQNMEVLGVIPLVTQLTYPTIAGLVDVLKPEILYGEQGMMNKVEKFVIGDMSPHHALDSLTKNTLMIVPGNREGLILTALCENMLRSESSGNVTGIIFTDGIRPHGKILELLEKMDIPLLQMEEDAFTVATRINNMILKIRSEDNDKIAKAEEIVGEYVDLDRILELSAS